MGVGTLTTYGQGYILYGLWKPWVYGHSQHAGRGIYYMETIGIWTPTTYGQGYLLHGKYRYMDAHNIWAGVFTTWKL